MDLSSRMLLFLEVVEMGSFAKVAENRLIDRSVVSKQITRLEDELQVRLLNRTTRSLSPTAAGKELLDKARALRELLNDTGRIAQTFHTEPKGKLKIAATEMLGRRFIHRAAMIYRERYRDVDIQLRLDDRMVDMVSEGFDVGFRLGTAKESSFIATKIARNPLVLVATPAFLERYGAPESVEELKNLPAAVYANCGYIGNRLPYQTADGVDHLTLNPAYLVNNDEAIFDAVMTGNYLTALVGYMVTDQFKNGTLVRLLPDVALEDFGAFYAVYPHRAPPLKTKLFIELVTELVREEADLWGGSAS